MTINQTQFLGLSVTNFNCSLGWNGDSTNLSVGLVSDDLAGDSFTYPLPGTPVQFIFNGFQMGGLVHSYKYSQSQAGRIFNVNIGDIREILAGTMIIIGSYNGSTLNTPNLINAFQYFEGGTGGFGSSEANDSGMPWRKIVNAVTSIVNNPIAGPFGGPIMLAGYQYTISLATLPAVPDDFRIGGDHISLLDLIDEICQAGACDYFFQLLPGNVITLSTIARTNAPTLGLINNWINSLPEVVSSETGVEFRNEIAGKFVVGGPKQDIFFQTYDPGISGDYTDDTIWPSWGYIPPGFAGAGDLNLGMGANDDHVVEVDARAVNINYPGACVDTYTFCVGELRAALESQNSWEMYLWWRNNEPTSGSGSNPTSQMYNDRAKTLGIIGDAHSEVYKFLGNKQRDLVLSQFGNLDPKQIKKSSESWDTQHEEEIKRLYDLVYSYATQYYGRQFLIRIPQVEDRVDPDTGKTTYSVEPVPYGFLDESVWPTAISNNLLPPDIQALQNEQGQIQCFARYDNAAYLDFSEVSPADVIYNSGGYSAFVKCDVEQGIGFLDWQTKFSPRALVNVRGTVRNRPIGSGTSYGGVFIDLAKKATLNGEVTNDEVNYITRQFGADKISVGNKGFIVQPDMVAVPLMSNISRYGPWKAIGANGKCDFEIDDSLVPWNYDGFTGMNAVGNGKVQQAYSAMLWSETGSVEIPGAPSLNLGSEVIAGGPYVTDIQVSIDPNAGVTTRYVMSTWSPRFGATSKLKEQRIQRFAKFNQKQKQFNRTILRKSQQARPPTDINGFIEQPKTARRSSNSSHEFIVGENIPRRIGAVSGYLPNVKIQPGYLTTAQLHSELYAEKAAATLDALFRPFTTLTNSGLSRTLSHYAVPTSGADSPTILELDPYKSGFFCAAITRGFDYPDDLGMTPGEFSTSGYRSMGHRFPMIGVGWGYDVDGKPVPNLADPVLNSGLYAASGLQDSFYPGYMDHPEYWKAAPVDIRYDYERGVWVGGGGGGKTRIVQVVGGPSGIFPKEFGSVYCCNAYVPSFIDVNNGKSVSLIKQDDEILAGNFRQNIIISGQYYIAYNIGGKYILDNQLVFQ